MAYYKLLAVRDAIWHFVFNVTGCADCAEAGAKGEAWRHREACWRANMPHVPVQKWEGSVSA